MTTGGYGTKLRSQKVNVKRYGIGISFAAEVAKGRNPLTRNRTGDRWIDVLPLQSTALPTELSADNTGRRHFLLHKIKLILAHP